MKQRSDTGARITQQPAERGEACGNRYLGSNKDSSAILLYRHNACRIGCKVARRVRPIREREGCSPVVRYGATMRAGGDRVTAVICIFLLPVASNLQLQLH